MISVIAWAITLAILFGLAWIIFRLIRRGDTVPFKRRISDFFTQGHWDVSLHSHPWELMLGGTFVIDAAPGFHFDRIGLYGHFAIWSFWIFWVDNN